MQYRKKPVVIEAIQFNDTSESIIKLSDFMQMELVINYNKPDNPKLLISTLEGIMEASEGDFIIKGVNGEFYPCKPDIFEKTYESLEETKCCGEIKIDNLTFGLAIEALKQGKKVTRSGWNGKGMFVVYQKGYPQGINCNKQTADAWGLNEGDLFKCEPYLQIKMVNGSHSMWVPSINDVLAEDWIIIE